MIISGMLVLFLMLCVIVGAGRFVAGAYPGSGRGNRQALSGIYSFRSYEERKKFRDNRKAWA